ncbi:MAG: YebC/PmpR family DNA-binding transcriptional regulator [Patescibacteria group bacterium]|nr:YebC/PmpR family DNA-binding transcriptional regulator [Patescibacteria group bacterium]
MSGHSKWSSIKHKKAATDAKKGKAFTKVANMISIAAKSGGDPSMNPALALAIDKAKEVNMPKANVERAIKKGTGELGGAQIEEVVYEGYGPEGVAFLIEVATDNKNRTVSEVRSTLVKGGGSMASAGAVSYVFERRGHIEVREKEQSLTAEEVEAAIIESGASDFSIEDGYTLVYTDPKDLMAVKKSLNESGVNTKNAELTYIPTQEVLIEDTEKAQKIMRLIDALEELEDVSNVFTNLQVSEEIAEELS